MYRSDRVGTGAWRPTMLFPTVDFAIFFTVVFTVSWLLVDNSFLRIIPYEIQGTVSAFLRSRSQWRKIFLILASYFFYGYWNWKFMFLLLACSVGNYLFGLALGRDCPDRTRRIILTSAVTWNLAILGFFKYFGFFVSSFNNLLTALHLDAHMPLVDIILPVGISFFTFQAMSYVIDVYRRDTPYARSLLDVLLYISFFPQLVAGPIVRARDFIPQLQRDPDPSRIAAARAFLLIIAGLFKKVIVANYIATELVDPVFEDPLKFSSPEVLLAVYGYAVQIYCDFAAYSEIAIGVAALMGYHFPDNFNNPYRAQSLRDFWRRWHISLSTWLRDYLFISLGGSRHGKWKTYMNIAITMVLGGLWHGASWNFVLWGALHGFGLMVERIFADIFGRREKAVFLQIISVIVVFHFVCLGWVFFRARSFTLAIEYLKALGNVHVASTLLTPFVIVLLVIGIGMHFMPPQPGIWARRSFSRLPALVQGVILALLLLALSAFGSEGVAPFIYFRF